MAIEKQENFSESSRVMVKKNIFLEQFGEYGFFYLARFTTKSFPKILMYHRFENTTFREGVSKNQFEKQLEILKRDFRVVSLSELTEEFEKKGFFSPYTVCLTIDDGYEDFYRNAFPLLKKFSLPATLFVPTDFIDSGNWHWPDLLELILCKTKYRDFSTSLSNGKKHFNLNNIEKRNQAWHLIADYCLELKENERSDFIQHIAKDLRVCRPNTPANGYKALKWEHLKEMQKYKIEIGSHTCSHSRLSLLSDTEIENEIILSKNKIESTLNKPVLSFAYPYGRVVDFKEQTALILRKNGFKVAVKAYFDRVFPREMFSLGRFGVGNNILDFKKKICGLTFLSHLIKWRA